MNLLTSALLFIGVLTFALSTPASSHFRKNSFPDTSQSDLSTGRPQDCLAVADARKHIGKTNCVTGTVVRVEEGNNGATFLDFCADYHSCSFTVVVFRADLRSLGDVRQLQGRTITIKGRIEEYDERAEIILRHPQQLGGSAGKLTALPKDYDVERQGHYGVGTFRPAKSKRARRKDEGEPVSIEDLEVP
jgi:DNA/RNA endonuclease YhcR with UshA esterase domain